MEEKALEKNLRAKANEVRGLLAALADRLASVEPWDVGSIEPVVRAFAEERGVKIGTLMNAARTALTGTGVGPGIFEVFEIVGRERAAARLLEAEGRL
jgi:glutamyl-tRNA synthetase